MTTSTKTLQRFLLLGGILSALILSLATAPARAAEPPTKPAAKPAPQKRFATPKEAADALIAAARTLDTAALTEILGQDGKSLVVTEDHVADQNRAAAFAKSADEKSSISQDPKTPKVATLVVGNEDWPLPIPIVNDGKGWRFDSKKGAREILYRRIGTNELDAIQICRGYAEAQLEYASEKHEGSTYQYAQRIVSTPGRRDGLAWMTPDGKWEGPVGEGIAKVIAEGHAKRYEPYHGYTFKILKGQGPAAPMGEMDFLVKNVMIGGFALVAAPAEYAVTGVKTFIVSHSGTVYEKDLGPKTVEKFKSMERFNPDKSWRPVAEN
jgi:hypothetical protein